MGLKLVRIGEHKASTLLCYGFACWGAHGGNAPSQGEHKASPLPCYGFASRCMHGGKGTFLSLHPEISLSVSFANRVLKGRGFQKGRSVKSPSSSVFLS